MATSSSINYPKWIVRLCLLGFLAPYVAALAVGWHANVWPATNTPNFLPPLGVTVTNSIVTNVSGLYTTVSVHTSLQVTNLFIPDHGILTQFTNQIFTNWFLLETNWFYVATNGVTNFLGITTLEPTNATAGLELSLG